ncbi:hypothetical protein FS837_007534 [Tulasnella sp. UAMH 9824]|nr:hypothetical protein FS837_007534 [Tulasnella sp. UAMH 9824]
MGEHSGVGRISRASTESQLGPSDQFLPPSSSSEDQRAAAFGLASHSLSHSGLSGTSGMAGASFATQINRSYEAMPFAYDASTLPAIGSSGIYSPVAPEAADSGVCLNRHSRIGCPSTRKTGGWSDEASRAKKVTKEYRNQLLHISIEALERSERIPRMPSLRDTMRAIILNCFNCNPTRQNIVDLLFDALPERTRMEVVELEVKKYLKDRIGHILSAPANKNMFVNISGTGRWTIGEGFD